MEPEKLLEALHTAEKLKDTTRHCYTSKGRHESVAEHSWRIALMAFWLRDEFPRADMDKVIHMCLIHDLGECFTGDIPAFDKTAADEAAEEALLSRWVDSLPEPVCTEMRTLYAEMAALQTTEAKIYKALDKMEALPVRLRLAGDDSQLRLLGGGHVHLGPTGANSPDQVHDGLHGVFLRREIQRLGILR